MGHLRGHAAAREDFFFFFFCRGSIDSHAPDVRTTRAAGKLMASRGGGIESKRRRADDVRAVGEGMNHRHGGNDLGAPTEQSQLLRRTGTRRYYTLFITHFRGDMMTLPRSGANVNIS